MECVSTYIHEVASVNAGNVYGMRFVADLLDRHGDSSRAAQFRAEAKDLAARINRLLYVPGKGWWKCGQPDGSFVEVRHCFDLFTILDTMFEDLSDAQKKEMARFFWSELQTPLWMHALSPGDADASWNPGAFNGPQGLRSDHTWIGSAFHLRNRQEITGRRKGWIEPAHLFQLAPRFLIEVQIKEASPLIEMSTGILGRESNGLIKLRQSIGGTVVVAECYPHIKMGFG